mgnify:CR=1 FL=1
MPNGTYGGVRGGIKFPLLDFLLSDQIYDNRKRKIGQRFYGLKGIWYNLQETEHAG